jgi:hypothetical protein
MRRIYHQTDSDGLSDVELEQEDALEARVCIDYGSLFHIELVFLAFLASVVYFGFTGASGPARVLTVLEVIPIRLDPEPPRIAAIDLRLTHFPQTMKFLNFTCRAIRSSSAAPADSLVFMIGESHRAVQGDALGAPSELRRLSAPVFFAKNSNISLAFPVLPIEIAGLDGLVVSAEIWIPNESIASLSFAYDYPNIAVAEYFRITRFIFSGTVLYGFVLYLTALPSISMADPSCVTVAFLGLVACNPSAFCLQHYPAVTAVIDNVLFACLANYFRFFVFEFLRELVSSKSLWIVEMYFVAFFGLDVAARCGWAKMVQVGWVVSYTVVVLHQFSRICCRGGEGSNRTFFFGSLQLCSVVAALFRDVVVENCAVLTLSIAPELIMYAVTFVGAACALIWLRTVDVGDLGASVAPRFVLED